MEAPEIDKTYSDTPAERDPGSNKAMYSKGTSKAMAAMNKLMKPTKQKKVMRKFQKQSAQLDMTMMSDAIDETLEKDEAEEETEELRNQLMAPLMTVLQNPVEFYHQLLLILASVTSVILQAVFQSEGIVGFKSTLLTGLADFSVVLFVMGLGLLVLVYTRYKYAGHHASVWTVSVVLEDYALLCMINKRYIEIFVIPVTILLFIVALAKKVREHGEKDATLKNAAESAKELMKMALVPYLLQLSFVVWTQYMGRLSDGIFIFPNFLLFFSSALCAVTVMIASPPIGESPGAGQVLPVMHKTCIIVFLMTAYSMAAEGLGEDIVFVCIPELTAVLAWFTICFHHPGHETTINSATSWSSGSIILSLVIAILTWLAPFHAKDGIILASWFIRVFCISISSSALSYFHVWLLRQWPGSTPDCNGLVQLLKFSSLISCIISAGIPLLTVISVDGQILHEATSSLQYNSIAAAVVVFMLMLSAAWLVLYFSRGAFSESNARKPRGDVIKPEIPETSGADAPKQEVLDDVLDKKVRATEVPSDISETDYVPEQEVADDVPETDNASEPEVGDDVPETDYVPEPEVANDVHYVPEPEVADDVHYVPEPEVADDVHETDNALEPEVPDVPETDYVPEPEVADDVPETDNASEPEVGDDVSEPEVAHDVSETDNASDPEVGDDVPETDYVSEPEVADDVSETDYVSEPEVGDDVPETDYVSEPEVHDVPEFIRTRPRSLIRSQSTHVEIHGSESTRLLPLWNMANELKRKLDDLSRHISFDMWQHGFSHRQLSSLVNRMTRNSNCEPAVFKLACDLNNLLDYMTQRQFQSYDFDDFLHHAYADNENAGMTNFTDKLAELKLGIAAVTEDSPRTEAPKVNPNLSGHYGVSMYAHAEQAKYLQEMLAHAGSERPEVVCIFQTGGGSWKMDLVVRVYQQIQDAQLFQSNVSVKADLNPDMAKLIKNMVTQAGTEYGIVKTPNVDQWTDMLSQVLHKKRYLIVVDDLRSKEDWSTIKQWFPDNKQRSRIIISTTCEDVAKTCDQFYWLPVPVEMEVETLFSKKICGSLSGIFASKPHAEDAFSGSGLQWKELEQMKELIRVRYNKLLPNLRICLLYLSIFQENHEIDIERLVRIWIANDFIYDLQGESEQDRQSMEQRARSYITELIVGKFIIPSQWNLDDTVRSCRVHQLVYEFIVYQATEEKLVLYRQEEKIVSSNHTVRRWHNITKPDKAGSGHQGPSLSHVVSVTVFGQARGIPPLTKRRLLRVLDFEDCEGPVCLDGLCELLLLRYLSLKGTDVSDLRSAQIGELKYLQTLDVRSTKVEELPSSIVSLENLMHLLAGNAKLPSCIGQMKGLLTLSCAIVGKSAVNAIEELSTIPNLEQLELEDQALEDQKQITFLSNGFSRLKKVRVKCSFSSVIFDIGALPMVEVLELKFEKEHPEKSARVSGIENLVSLTRVIVEFSQHGKGSRETLAAVTKAGRINKNHPKVIFPGF